MAEQVWWAGLAAAVVLAAWWLWGRRAAHVYRHGGWWSREWRRPYIRIVRPADRHFGFVLNRYVQHVVIGVALYVGRWGLSLVWARPRFIPDRSLDAHIDQALDVVAEPDRRRAEHMNRTLRRVEGGDET